MLTLDAEDRLIIARLQSPAQTGVAARVIHEAAILIPCVLIFWFAAIWGDVAALIIGPGLYVGYQLYRSFTELNRQRRLGEILIAYEEERERWAGVELIGTDEPSDDDGVYALVPSDPESEVADCFRRAAEETEAAAGHYRTAAKRFEDRKIPRGCAHAFAALGHLQAARREARIAASIHSRKATEE